jgi:hypothetical protein
MSQSTQRELFQILLEFFKKVIGKRPTEFADLHSFNLYLKKNSESIGKRCDNRFPEAMEALFQYYSKQEFSTFHYAKEIGGMKLVLGGSSRFTQTHLDSVRKMLLYTDTILIPDPILPWIEVDREEEKFPTVNLLQNMFTLLCLKPVVDADLSYPAIIVFPSFEKRLEENDEETKRMIEGLVLNVLSFYTGHNFDSLKSAFDFAQNSESEFLQLVDTSGLFVAPGGEVGTSLKKAIEEYKFDIRTKRSEKYANVYLNAPDGVLILNGIMERIAPQWHLLENATELHSQPMLCLDAQWHYYSLCANTFQGKLLENELLEKETINTLRALSNKQLNWLGNVPIDSLAKLREDNENEIFRKKIAGFVAELNESTVNDINRVGSEIGRGIASLLSEHKKEINKIQSKYDLLYGKTAVASWITLAATFFPALAPFASLTPALAGKYIWDKIAETREKKQLSQSLMGVLASAKE